MVKNTQRNDAEPRLNAPDESLKIKTKPRETGSGDNFPKGNHRKEGVTMVTIWKNIPNFKIRAKSDVRKFLTECLCSNQTYMIKIRGDYAIFIKTFKDKPTEISAKFGDLSDIFNPLIALDEHEAINALWFYRKKVNEQFFS